MKLTIHFRGQLASSEGTDHVTRDVEPGTLIRTVILNTVQNEIVQNADGIRRTLLVAIDGEQTLDLDTPVTESMREITLIPPIAGG